MSRDDRQRQMFKWAVDAFGVGEVQNLPQRGLRLLEEAVEVYQACGGTAELAHKLVDFVFARPAGSLGQELGGVAVCLLVLAEAGGYSADGEEKREIDRVLAKPREHFTERNAAKNAAGLIQRELCCDGCGKATALGDAYFDTVNNRTECGACAGIDRNA